METTRHPFEVFGPGPYRYIGHSTETYQAVRGDPSCPIQPGASCDYCGIGIYEVFRFRTANGVVFKVGCDCAERSGDKKILSAIKADVLKHRREVAHKRADTVIDRALAALPTAREALTAKPHPNQWRAAKGATLADWCDWMLANAGRSGKTEAAKVILAHI